MAQTIANSTDRMRPSSRLQSPNLLDSTPVLFRLPVVQVQTFPPVADQLPESSLATLPNEECSVSHAQQPDAVSIMQQPASDQPRQSWWEHWSSGVIVMLMLVALYVACVAALRAKQVRHGSTIAQETAEAADLASALTPPEITDQPAFSEQSTAELAVDAPPVASAESTDLDANELSNSLNGLESLAANSPKNGAVTDDSSVPTTATEKESVATAELLLPTQMPTSSLPMLGDSVPRSQSNLTSQPVSTQLGQSPALYDGAAVQPNLPSSTQLPLFPQASSSAQSNLAQSNPLVGQTNAGATLPAIPNMIGGGVAPSASPTLSTASTQQSVSATASSGTTATTGVPSAGGETAFQAAAGSVGSTGLRQTSTPTANGEVDAIIRAYIELMQAAPANSAVNGQSPATTNRYQPPVLQ